MRSNKMCTVVGVFNDSSSAQQAVRALKDAGFTDEQIGVVTQDSSGSTAGESTGSHITEGALAGVATGAGVGALWALGIAANIVPGIGPVISGGILASILASAAGGAAIAGVVGALVGLGIPEEDAHYYEGEFKAGRTLVTVKAETRSEEAWAILSRFGAYNRQNSEATGVNRDASDMKAPGRYTDAGKTVQVHEEQLRASKTPVKTGEVHVRKDVISEQRTIQVPVTREEVVIEHRPASGTRRGGSVGNSEEIRIPVSEERVNVSKETVTTGEVSVGKRQVTENQQVSGTVRKESVHVEKEGDVTVRETGTPRRPTR